MEKMCPPLQGLRHLALRVRDIRESKDFYLRIFGLKVVWEPDPQNCYLSSGTDNLALHEVPAEGAAVPASTPTSPLDHFGFIAGNPLILSLYSRYVNYKLGAALNEKEFAGRMYSFIAVKPL